ncbi:MAG TPA: glutaredoxin family protein [Gemmataceae bacterium]|nr:glutaredoxin family protein [Gemmataceae bacterium]
MLSWLFFWRRRNLQHIQVQMVTRAGCHLCDEAWQQLDAARQRHGFRLTAVDVDAGPDLVSQYGDCVPVVLVDGKVRFRGRINPVLLDRLLRAEGGKTKKNKPNEVGS